MIKEHDLVSNPVDKECFPAGTKGVVVNIYSSGPACEVEAWDDKNYPVDVVTYGLDEVKRCGDYGTKGIKCDAS